MAEIRECPVCGGPVKVLEHDHQWSYSLAALPGVDIVRCKECKHRGSPYGCPMRHLVLPFSGPGSFEDCSEDEGYCHKGERDDENA